MNNQADAATLKAQTRLPYASTLLQTEASPYKGEEFKNSPPTVASIAGVKGPQAAVNRRNGQGDMGVVYGEKQW